MREAAGPQRKAAGAKGRGVRPATRLPAPVAEALDPTAAVTLVQISTTFCAPCRQTRALLTHLADKTDGLHHVDLDVTNQPEVAQRLGVLRTPTTVAYAADGRELLRVGGLPKAPDLLKALEPHLQLSA
ncbi:thioredoxin family protein [Amycolatopsis sp. 195334CR]|uniref:TlpA family protein disulfide reductase n=1 Tax=Amycolatopsis sp. 195334CR TaxID=2814588 RepID=UPI001A8F2B00|nr:thioredoxin family protein [Amycolatopsis sp. 195334CR]